MNEVSEECLLTDGEINRFLSSPSPEEEPIDWSQDLFLKGSLPMSAYTLMYMYETIGTG
jgi:hypothetical protein